MNAWTLKNARVFFALASQVKIDVTFRRLTNWLCELPLELVPKGFVVESLAVLIPVITQRSILGDTNTLFVRIKQNIEQSLRSQMWAIVQSVGASYIGQCVDNSAVGLGPSSVLVQKGKQLELGSAEVRTPSGNYIS